MKYKKKPVAIEAFQFDGDLKGSDGKYYVPEWAVKAFEEGILYFDALTPDTPPIELFNKNFEKPEDILKCASRNGGHSYNLLCLLIGRAFIKKKPFYPKYGEMVYYVTVSGYIQEVRFDTDSTLHQLLRKAGKLYRSEEEAIRHLDKDHKDLIIQEEE